MVRIQAPSRRPDGQHLPPRLCAVAKEFDEAMSFRAKISAAMRTRQRGDVKQNAAGTVSKIKEQLQPFCSQRSFHFRWRRNTTTERERTV
jgi:hypothetical protein